MVNNAEKAGRKPDENWIQIVMSSYFKMQPQDKDGIGDALKKMVRYYPKTRILGKPARHLSPQRRR